MESSDDDENFGEGAERFDDFTVASSWERFISDIEAVVRQCLADNPQNLLVKGAVGSNCSRNLYEMKFDLKDTKKNYCIFYHFATHESKKNTHWASTLHDIQLAFGVNNFLLIAPQSASRVILDAPEASKLLSGVAIALTNCSCLLAAFVPVHDPSRRSYVGVQNLDTVSTRRFESDRIGSQVPVRLMHLEGLYELFVSKFSLSAISAEVFLSMKLTYKTLPNDGMDDESEDDGTETIRFSDSIEECVRKGSQWDDDCPWSEWYSVEDPVKGFELISLWSEKMVGSSTEMDELENSSPHEAENWILVPNISSKLESVGVGFTSQLCLLVDAHNASFQAKFMEDFISAENSSNDLNSLLPIPPPTVVDRVIKDLFNAEEDRFSSSLKFDDHCSRTIKGAPLTSLFALLCLHVLWFGNCNIRTISLLWIEFVREVRWCWEEGHPLPRVPVSGVIDLSSCLIHQKLHMLGICIERRRKLIPEDLETAESKKTPLKQLQLPENLSFHTQSPSLEGSGMLLNSNENMSVPLTQDAPPMTEDMHEERLHAVEVFGDSLKFSAQLEREILSSDMSAFKAANQRASFEDFIRWHSPADWEDDGNDHDWPPRGKLSQRMSGNHNNTWRNIWNEAPALSAKEQKPLMDPNSEGEKALHYLETVRPRQLLEQMVCTAFRAAADTLQQTNHGGMHVITSKLDQLYRTLSSVLKPSPHESACTGKGNLEDLKRACVALGHVERLLVVAASLHRKFPQSPRLSKAVFESFYDFYRPRMGIESTEHVSSEFKAEVDVSESEWSVVEKLFTPLNSAQSWRRVMSLGNLLNGHEPVMREIIFFGRDARATDYTATPTAPSVDTYRMYIRETSDSLEVAMSTVSRD